MREIERQLAEPEPDLPVIRSIAAEYERQIAETQVNHTPTDLRRWTYAEAKSDNPMIQILLLIRRQAFDLWFYISTMFVYLALVLFIIAITGWYAIYVALGDIPYD